jgi:predicted Ser/Thr protein kinase
MAIIYLNFSRSIHEIDLANLTEFSSGQTENKIGEGTFGVCVKKMYRGHVVAVKQFKSHTSRTDVEKEAIMINSFDHPGMKIINYYHYGGTVK